MSGPYFIETLARNGEVLHRQQLGALPIRLGRGYDNDFIVDDAHAAPRHAVIEANEQGQLVLRDLGSRNGVIHLGKRRAKVVLTGDTVVRMGHTNLRVRGADFPVPAELVDRTMHAWEGAIPGLAGMILIGLVAVFVTWLGDTEPFQLIGYLQALAYGVGAALVWGALWAFANRLFGRHARFGRHLFIFGCGMASIVLYKVASSVAAYAFSLDALIRYGSHVALALVAGMVFYHLATVRPQHRRRFASACLMLALLGSGLTLIANEQGGERLADHLYMPLLLPPSLRVSPEHSVNDFMASVKGMKAGLDAERIESAAQDEGRPK